MADQIPTLEMGMAFFMVHAHECVLSINEDDADIGYAKIYRVLLQATGKERKQFQFFFCLQHTLLLNNGVVLKTNGHLIKCTSKLLFIFSNKGPLESESKAKVSRSTVALKSGKRLRPVVQSCVVEDLFKAIFTEGLLGFAGGLRLVPCRFLC